MKKPTIIVFTGAGISAESGIKTFRDADGLWEGYDVQTVASIEGWHSNKALVLDFYNQRRKQLLTVKPNAAHAAIANLEKFYNVIVVTQNVDDLHERAGSTNIIHLHGKLLEMKSEKNDALVYPICGDIILGDTATDGAQLRPNIVWFGEMVPEMDTAAYATTKADALLVVGTSLQVYPAASLLQYAPSKAPIIVVDKQIPEISNREIIAIENTATKGVALATNWLRKHFELG